MSEVYISGSRVVTNAFHASRAFKIDQSILVRRLYQIDISIEFYKANFKRLQNDGSIEITKSGFMMLVGIFFDGNKINDEIQQIINDFNEQENALQDKQLLDGKRMLITFENGNIVDVKNVADNAFVANKENIYDVLQYLLPGMQLMEKTELAG